MIKEVIVVEGKADTAAIKRAVEADTIETGGSAVDDTVIQQIQRAQHKRGVIIFTDPDHAGERIRRIVSSRVKGCKHAFITQEEAHHNGDIGVENASKETIRKALANVKSDEDHEQASEISWEDLQGAGLIHHPQAFQRRLAMGNLLGIGYGNGKQFYKKCEKFQISKEEFLTAYQQIEREAQA
ncbi:MAG: ribonuclease M5 [Paenibacillus sp. RIFOXYA1_FULL_44_5]|nr:MAG: ribonuclease M5 [Paenibacillus sp. RIFOXYA1_FULL_44_5]